MKDQELRRHMKNGLRKAGVYALGEMMRRTPYRTGHLVNSYNIHPILEITPFNFELAIENTADYAAAVHEMPEHYNFTKPGTGPKFMQGVLNEKGLEIIGIIQKEVMKGT